MADPSINQILAQAAADPGIRHQAIKDAHRLARQFVSLLIATEELARAADLDAAHRAAQARVDELLAESEDIRARIVVEADATREEAQAAVDKLRAEASELGARSAAAQRREKGLNTSLATLEGSIRSAQARLDDLMQREEALRPVVEQAEQAEARLASAQSALAEIEARRAELLKSLGAV